jgi:hypothetical protein
VISHSDFYMPAGPAKRRPVPIWVPDAGDPDGLEGTWELVDPDAPALDPQRAAQASAVALMWRSAPAA